MKPVQQIVDTVYKENYGKIVASLLCFSGSMETGTAEDIVQDAFSAALTDWQLKGVPDNPTGWIYRVCRNKALNKLKKDNRLKKIPGAIPESAEMSFPESPVDDHQLKLLFACAHPELSPRVQVAITLKYVANLKAEAIARALGMTRDGVDKLLLRARQKIRDARILLAEPGADALGHRICSVHKVIYLIFNEGYKSSAGDELVREELCEDALLMNKALLDSGLGNSETKALYALMLFNSARLASRFGISGELIDLENQDRARWNYDLIAWGSYYLRQSQNETVTAYHLEASIAWLHCRAKSFDATEWPLIAGLYARLLKEKPNPFVELNYGIALYYAGQKQMAFQRLHALLHHPFLSRYYLLNTALGKFYCLEGDQALARQFLSNAHRQTDFVKEKEFIQKMIDRT